MWQNVKLSLLNDIIVTWGPLILAIYKYAFLVVVKLWSYYITLVQEINVINSRIQRNVEKHMHRQQGATRLYIAVLASSQFHQHFTYEKFVRALFRQLFSSYMCVEKAAKTMFVRKICTWNVDEIDTCLPSQI